MIQQSKINGVVASKATTSTVEEYSQKSRKAIYAVFILVVITITVGCKKQDDFLAKKPNDALSAISTLEDAQNLLNYEELFNRSIDPSLGQGSCDEYYITAAQWLRIPVIDQNTYIWNKDIYEVGADVLDWSNPYQQIYYANTVLEAVEKMNVPQNRLEQASQIKGSALFFRAYALYNLLQTFALPYDKNTAATDLGVPIRTSSDLNIKSVRASQEQCYSQIFTDLKNALQLLPANSRFPTQPNKASTYALLARINLAVGDYQNALDNATACLNITSALTNFNNLQYAGFTLTTSPNRYLSEDLYHVTLNTSNVISFSSAIVDSTLYSLYDNNDLRKTYFFTTYRNAIRFKGSFEYNNFGERFSGLAVDEMYLIAAECNARIGQVATAMDQLNKLLENRWKSGTFVPYTASSQDEAIKLILTERRKELCFRGLRWTDLRRLNKDPRFATTLIRVINGQTYTLPPNDPRYALPIPDKEIKLSGIEQNKR